MKKGFMKIRRGLLEPKHREAIGNNIWLFMYMIDRADWDTGIIPDWKDKAEAEELEMNWRTLQRQRQALEAAGYIICSQQFQKQQVQIATWEDPRKHGTQTRVPYEAHGTQKCVPYDYTNLRTITFNPDLNTQIEEVKDKILYIDKFKDHLKGSPDFVNQWQAWLEYRKTARKKKVSPQAATLQSKLLNKYSPEDAIKIIEQSIANDYQGLFELKDKKQQEPGIYKAIRGAMEEG